MTPTSDDSGINRLSVAERIDLALRIWESLGPDLPMPVLTPEQRAELRRRDAELEANPAMGLTWDEIKKSVRGDR
jgi:putative addiction module component (TIGR02574 family)